MVCLKTLGCYGIFGYFNIVKEKAKMIKKRLDDFILADVLNTYRKMNAFFALLCCTLVHTEEVNMQFVIFRDIDCGREKKKTPKTVYCQPSKLLW